MSSAERFFGGAVLRALEEETPGQKRDAVLARRLAAEPAVEEDLDPHRLHARRPLDDERQAVFQLLCAELDLAAALLFRRRLLRGLTARLHDRHREAAQVEPAARRGDDLLRGHGLDAVHVPLAEARVAGGEVVPAD
ncbi:MAG: hypothetical protein ACYTEZ_19860, partial [Planctomycetota bacterium]